MDGEPNSPFRAGERADNTWKEEIEFRRKLNDERPWPRPDRPLLKPEWVPSDVPTEHEHPDGGWMKLQL
jgi:hypothetical protein